ncbi:MAG: helix-turn-helix domain-containing protein [Ruminococcaceae bacterium]|nr:helix-turn-helix domain-containing protein [Oscillospiraceae bacterium]
MKKNTVLKIEMGNVTITVLMQGFWVELQKGNSDIHNHASFEFHMIMQGDVMLDTDNGSMKLTENDCALIPPEFFHGFKRPDKESAVLAFQFYVKKNARKNCADYAKLVQEHFVQSEQVITIRQNSQIKECLKKIASRIYESTLVTEDIMRAEFTLLFAEIFSLLDDEEGSMGECVNEVGENDTRIFIIEEYFNQYYMENISLKSLSAILFLSEKQTDRMIKKAFGEGFRQHLCKIRMLVAQRFLVDSDKEVQKIAEEVGYRSYNGFYLAFRQKNNMTPLEYRDRCRKGDKDNALL